MTDTHYRLAPVTAPARPFSALAVMAFLLSLTPFFVPYDKNMPVISHSFAALAVVLSVPFGVVALRRINKHGHDGQALAIAGLVISGAIFAWFALQTIVYGI